MFAESVESVCRSRTPVGCPHPFPCAPGRHMPSTHAQLDGLLPATMTVAPAMPNDSPPALQSRAKAPSLTPRSRRSPPPRAGRGREIPGRTRRGAARGPLEPGRPAQDGFVAAAVVGIDKPGHHRGRGERQLPSSATQMCQCGTPPQPTAARPPPQPHGRTVVSAPTTGDPAPRRVDGGKPWRVPHPPRSRPASRPFPPIVRPLTAPHVCPGRGPPLPPAPGAGGMRGTPRAPKGFDSLGPAQRDGGPCGRITRVSPFVCCFTNETLTD